MNSGVDWRQKLETQRGAVLATELKNNANKLAKWTAAALVAGADMIKLGYVSRAHPRDSHNHVILGTQVGHPSRSAVVPDASPESSTIAVMRGLQAVFAMLQAIAEAAQCCHPYGAEPLWH